MHTLKFQSADLIFIRSKRWIDFPIKLVTQSQYTHVAGYVDSNNLIEAQGLRKTGYVTPDTYLDVSDVYRDPTLSLQQREQIVTFAKREIGSQYDYVLIGWEALRLVFGTVLPYAKNNRRICSTLWADAYKSAGVDLCPYHSYPTPSDLVKSPHLRKIGTF